MTTVSGLGLALVLANDSHSLEIRTQEVGAEAVVTREVQYLKTLTAQWFVSVDLVLGAGQSYVVDGALQQSTEIRRMVAELGQTGPLPAGQQNLSTIDGIVERVAQWIREAATLDGEGREQRLVSLLEDADRETSRLTKALRTLDEDTASRAREAVIALDESRAQFPIIALSLTLAYLIMVLAVWRWSLRSVVTPLQQLESAARGSLENAVPFTMTAAGPLEVRSLTHHVHTIVQSLELKVSERTRALKTSNQNLTSARAKLEQVLDRAHDLIFSLNYDGTIHLTNPSARTVLELSDSNANLMGLLKDGSQLDLTEFPRHEDAGEVTLDLVTPSGQMVELHGRVLPLELEDSDDLIAFFRDVTEEIRVSRELAQTNKELARSQRMDSVGRLAGAVAHDFNNLLAVIMGSAELSLRSVDRSDQLTEDLELILSTARKGREISRQLQMVSVTTPEESGRCDIITVIDDLSPILELMAGRGSLNVDLEMDHCWVDISPSQVEQVLMNLVINGSEAIAEGGHIGLRAHVDPLTSRCSLTVSDDGAGIDAETIDRIFEPYFTTKQATSGSGIGLSTVFGIVRDAKGTIEVQSEIDRGTRFLLRLPLSSDQSPLQKTEAQLPNGQLHGLAVLVEDNAGVNQVVTRQLEDMGLEVTSHHGFETARAGWEHAAPKADILITDVSLGDGCGLELARESMEDDRCRSVLILTGHADMDRLSSMIETYKWGLLLKPFGASELRDKVRERLEHI